MRLCSASYIPHTIARHSPRKRHFPAYSCRLCISCFTASCAASRSSLCARIHTLPRCRRSYPCRRSSSPGISRRFALPNTSLCVKSEAEKHPPCPLLPPSIRHVGFLILLSTLSIEVHYVIYQSRAPVYIQFLPPAHHSPSVYICRCTAFTQPLELVHSSPIGQLAHIS